MMVKQGGISDSFGIGLLHDNIIALIMLEGWSNVKTIVSMYSPRLSTIRFDVHQTLCTWWCHGC